MPKDIGYLGYKPSTKEGKKLANILNELDQRENIYMKEKNKLIKRRAVMEARKKLNIIKPKRTRLFKSFITKKIRFG